MIALFKCIIGIILISFSCLSFIYYKRLNSLSSKVSFSKFWVIFGAISLSSGLFFIFYKKSVLNNHPTIKIVLISFLVLVMSLCIILEVLIIYSGAVKEEGNEDYLIILGAGLNGMQISRSLYERLLEGLNYLNSKPNLKVVVSGGQGPGEEITEAEAMKNFLVSNGINSNRIIIEDKSKNTYENFKFTKELLDKFDGRENIKLRIISNNFHIFRSKMIAKRIGFVPYGHPSNMYPILIPNYYVREIFAFIKSYLFDR